MPAKFEEIQQRWDRVFLVPGTQPVWEKSGHIIVPPGVNAFLAFQSPDRWRSVIDNLKVIPYGPLSTQFTTFSVEINGQGYKPSSSIFLPPDSDMVFEIEHPNKILIPAGQTFRFVIVNTSPVLFVGMYLEARIALERVAN